MSETLSPGMGNVVAMDPRMSAQNFNFRVDFMVEPKSFLAQVVCVCIYVCMCVCVCAWMC